jgi:hypothetical protein
LKRVRAKDIYRDGNSRTTAQDYSFFFQKKLEMNQKALENPNPTIYHVGEIKRIETEYNDEEVRDEFDAIEIFDIQLNPTPIN